MTEDRAISLNAVLATIYDSSGNFKNDFDQGFFADKIRELPPATPQFIPIEGDGFEKTLPEIYPEGEKFSFQEAKGYYPLPKMDLLKSEQMEARHE